MDVYTMEQWKQDRDFKAQPGQEISRGVYEEMLCVMPPLSLPQNKARQALRDYHVPVHAGFLMGEPVGCNLFHAFGSNDYGKGKHYYYLGLSRPAPELQDGDYHYFDCMNALVNDGLFTAGDFKDDNEAIEKAADYEATLYKYTYKDGQRTGSRILYEPQFY